MSALAFWTRRLTALERKIKAVEAGELELPEHGDRNALYDARAGVAGLLAELRAKAELGPQ